MTWIDYTVGGIVILVGLFIFYRALKEPLDLLFSAIGKMFSMIGEGLSSSSEKKPIGSYIEYG